MKTIAVICADFERSFLGLPSRLQEELCGETVIRRTIMQLRKTPRLASIHLLVDVSQEATARSAVGDLDVSVETHQAGPPPWSRYVASGRKWSLDAWRGGLAGTMVYDETIHPWLLEALARRESADAVIDVPATAPLLDPVLLGELVSYYEKIRDDVRLGLVQAAPGLSAAIYHPVFLAGLAEAAQPPGRVLAYHPEDPRHDAIHQPCWFAADATIAHAWGRCIADTGTAIARLHRAYRDLAGSNGETPDALTVSRWLLDHRTEGLGSLPQEVEIEITTDDPLADSPLRPRGTALGRRGVMDFEQYRRTIDELAACDDRLVVLGGFGDPLCHPQWPQFVQYARNRGILGIALRTTGVNLDAAAIDAMIACELDVLNVLVDAATPETYRKLHHSDNFERVVANIEQLCCVQQQRQAPRPLIVCEMIKTPESMDDVEPFYDRWMRQTGSAVIAGPSHYAGQWPDRAVVRMSPPSRSACVRLAKRAIILADGRMTLCDQDFRGQHAIGSPAENGLAAIWHGPALAEIRQKHADGAYHDLSLCHGCDEWHRP